MYSKTIFLNRNYIRAIAREISGTYSRVFIADVNGATNYVFVDMDMMLRLIDVDRALTDIPGFNMDITALKKKRINDRSDRITLDLSYRVDGGRHIMNDARIHGMGPVLASFVGTPFSQPTNIVPKGDVCYSKTEFVPTDRIRKKHQKIIKNNFGQMIPPLVTRIRGNWHTYATWISDTCRFTCILQKQRRG